jgi:hypothetical protein
LVKRHDKGRQKLFMKFTLALVLVTVFTLALVLVTVLLPPLYDTDLN